MKDFTKAELNKLYEALCDAERSSVARDTNDSEVNYRIELHNLKKKVFDNWCELDDLEEAAKITHDKTIKPFASGQILAFKGSNVWKKERTIYTDGAKFYAKWHGNYIEVKRNTRSAFAMWSTIDEYDV